MTGALWDGMRLSIGLGLAAALSAADAPTGRVRFNRDIRPIMADTCFRCHGPDAGSRMAGLRLDIREEALKPTASGAAPIVPGDPAKSAIVERVFSANTAKLMPPKYSHKTLTAAQKETIRRWVAEGAEYEGHWAYLPVERPAPPAADGAMARNAIDAFIQERLAREGLRPAPEADRRTLIRRVSLDLTGIPPTPAEIRAFLADGAPGAYERLVDRLMASPRYAEKQAMHWLDAVRYADTCGFHGDNAYPAWPYRDYVLRAFRDNKPFDQFTREQLAGDLLPNATVEQRVAAAYNRLNRTSAEGGIQPKEYLAKYAADRVRTTSAVWMGSTMGCAECHDHKFDPFQARDFYSMKAFFADIKETGLVPDRGPKAWGAQIKLPSPEQQRQFDALTAQAAAARAALASKGEPSPEWEKKLLADYEAGKLTWKLQRPVAARATGGAKLTVFNDDPVDTSYDFAGSLVSEKRPGEGIVVAGGANPDNSIYTVTLRPGAGTWTALGVEVIQDESLPGVRTARGSDRFVLTEVRALSGAAPVAVAHATSSLNFPVAEHPAMAAIDGDPKTGWGVATYGENQNPFLALRFAKPLRTTAVSLVTVRLHFDSDYRRATVGRFRLALSDASHAWPGRNTVGARAPKSPVNGLPDDVLKALRAAPDKRTKAQAKEIRDHHAWMTGARAELDMLEARLSMLDAAIPRVLETTATAPETTRVLPRGNWMDDSGEVVEPAIPGFLGKLDTAGRASRLDLAEWLVAKNNPLTARTFVNRQWRQFFGAGLSKVLDDLGSQGEWPTHPELLDWLAAEFMQPQAPGTHAWDIKHLTRTIVLSHTYRQASQAPEAEKKDPDNRLLARQSRLRVDAEIVRDIALSVAGLLNENFGGPSAKPYQPEGYLQALNFPKREYSASRGANLYRRGVYVHWQRTFLHPAMATFDAPTREECTVNRSNSNTPLQALVLLNDPEFVEAARVLGQKMVAAGATPAARIAWAFERATGRPPRAEETAVLRDLYRKAAAQYRAAPGDAAKLAAAGEAPRGKSAPAEVAAATTVARAILNLHETITRN